MSKNKKELIHEVKLSLMRDCEIYGKSFKEKQVYFKSKGYTLSQAQSTRLTQELHSPEKIRNWFSKEALYAIEDDHMLSVSRIRELDEAVYKQLKILIDKGPLSSRDVYSLDKLAARFESLQLTKTKLFSATPLVQSLMEVHRQQEENENSQQYAE